MDWQVEVLLRETLLNPDYGFLDLSRAMQLCLAGFAVAFFLQSLEYLRLSPFIAKFLKLNMSYEQEQRGAKVVAYFSLGVSVLGFVFAVVSLGGMQEGIGVYVASFKVAAILSSLLGLLHLWWVWRMSGPFGGGSDYVVATGLLCLTVGFVFESAAPYAMAYLGVQTFLSYFLAGFVKLRNKQWWNGEVLRTVVLSSQYRAPVWLRRMCEKRRWPALLASWATILLEIGVLIAFFSEDYFLVFLLCAVAFHVLNFAIFGLNRFVWAWVAAYPAMLFLRTLIIY